MVSGADLALEKMLKRDIIFRVLGECPPQLAGRKSVYVSGVYLFIKYAEKTGGDCPKAFYRDWPRLSSGFGCEVTPAPDCRVNV
jgi:hypothetical protein